MFFHLGQFFLSWHACYVKGRSLSCSPGRGNAPSCAVMLYVGEGPRGSNGVLAALSTGFQSFTPLPTIKLGPSGAGSPVGGLVHSLGPCGSLQNLSCEAGSFSCCWSQPPRAFSIRGLRLYFPALEPWGERSALLPAVCPVYLCTNVGPWGATRRSACPILRHSESSPLGLSAGMWGCRVCQWSDCLPSWSHSPPVSVRHSNWSSLRPVCRLRPSYRSG